MKRAFELRDKSDPSKVVGRITVEGGDIDFSHHETTVTILEEGRQRSLLIAMSTPRFQLAEVPLKEENAAATS